MEPTYEIEIKSLLGTKEKADEFRQKLTEMVPSLQFQRSYSQKNHYFTLPENLFSLEEKLQQHLSSDKQKALQHILKEGNSHSIRSKNADNIVSLVIKASLDDDSSHNGVSRIEFEAPVPMTMDELDILLTQAGLAYQAKWSRDREEFTANDMNITIDRNAGYGYVTEIEKIVTNRELIPIVKGEILGFMKELGIEELQQDRLERMFEYYNNNWHEYYGTDKVFEIE